MTQGLHFHMGDQCTTSLSKGSVVRMVKHVQHPTFYATNSTWSLVVLNAVEFQPTQTVPDPGVTLLIAAYSNKSHPISFGDDPGIVQNGI